VAVVVRRQLLSRMRVLVLAPLGVMLVPVTMRVLVLMGVLCSVM